MYDYFLSYSRNLPTNDIENLVVSCEKYNIKIWRDTDYITAGSTVKSTVQDTLVQSLDSYGAIIIIDRSYLNKSWCLNELHFFVENRIRIYPFCLDCTPAYVLEKEPCLQDYNLCIIKDFDMNNYHYIITNIILKYMIEESIMDINENQIIEQDDILLELYRDFLTGNSFSSVIVKGHALVDWIIYKMYMYYENDIGAKNINKNAFIKNIDYPNIFKIAVAYIDISYKMVIGTAKLVSHQEILCIDVCIKYLINTYLQRLNHKEYL